MGVGRNFVKCSIDCASKGLSHPPDVHSTSNTFDTICNLGHTQIIASSRFSKVLFHVKNTAANKGAIHEKQPLAFRSFAMNERIHTYTEGDYLEVVQLESEGSSIKKQRRLLRALMVASIRNRWLLSGLAVIALGIAFKAFWFGMVYREEWLCGVGVGLVWLSGFNLARKKTSLHRWIGRAQLGVAVVLCLLLFVGTSHPKISHGLAMHWLSRSKTLVNVPGYPDLKLSYFAAFSKPVDDMFIWSVEGELPERVLRDLRIRRQLSINISPTSSSGIAPRTISNISRAFSAASVRTNFEAGSLNDLSDEDLAKMTQAGIVIRTPIVYGEIKPSVADYLMSPNISPLVDIECKGLVARDFQILESVAKSKGGFRFMSLLDCQLDRETAPLIANSASSVFLPGSADQFGDPKRLTSEAVDAILSSKVPIQNMDVDFLTKQQCTDLASIKTLSLLNVKDLDGESVDLLAAGTIRTIGLDFLSREAAQAMVRNRVTWRLSAGSTDADFATLMSLVQLPTLQSFDLLSKSQFTRHQAEQLDK
jgi:hypothetical protein